jgi:signal transduction histidine kinase/CheY-like chemotaxis protein
MSWPIISLGIKDEHDVVASRQRARQVAALLGFDAGEQTRIATAVSEIARNAFRYGHDGKVDFIVEGKTAPQVLVVRISDQGPGVTGLHRILSGQYRSSTGMGLGIVGARRLMDQFHIESEPGRGTTVWLRKIFPKHTPLVSPRSLAKIADELGRQTPRTPLEEIQQQNQELLRTLDELRTRQEELARLNSELEDTNRGVVALYAELDEKADYLRRADEMKSRFLSNMSHEFRTPLNSILALSRLLLERADGPLTGEQETQVGFVRKAAEDLSELINDLLDLAKVEAGKVVVQAVEFEVANLFGALRGMLRPLLLNDAVALLFEEPQGLPPLVTDEGKVSQILRNFISNALKFTERGEVRVSAAMTPAGDAVVFSVADTGIGIAPRDQQRIFEEFSQLDSPVQKKVKGTGLGLPLTRKLAHLLGGRVWVESAPGVGATFSALIPLVYREPVSAETPAAAWQADPSRVPVLVVEDEAADALVLEKFLRGSRFQAVMVRTLREARGALSTVKPKAVVLDIRLKGEEAWGFLAELKGTEETRGLPVLVTTTIEDQQKRLSLGSDAYGLKPIQRRWLLESLDLLTGERPGGRILVIDDDEVSRYLLRGLLAETRCAVVEAATGPDGIRLAREQRPDAVLLDLVMPDMTGFEVLQQLKADPATVDIPVIVVTSKVLEEEEYRRLAPSTAAILSKHAASREAAVSEMRQALAQAGLEGRMGDG